MKGRAVQIIFIHHPLPGKVRFISIKKMVQRLS